MAEEPAVTDRRPDPLFVHSLQRALMVLEAFDSTARNLSLSDLSRKTGLNKSAVQRFLFTWEALGYLEKDTDTKRYSLSPKVMSLSYHYLKDKRLVEIATPVLLEMRKRTGCASYLGILYEQDVMYLIRLPQRFILLESTLAGRRVPAFCGGRALLSCLPQNSARSLIEQSVRTQLTPFTITDSEANMRAVRQAAELGYAVSRQEQLIGEVSVSAPVLSSGGTLLAAVYISADNNEWDDSRIAAELAPVVLKAASDIGRQF
ncbi:IclR family transcriptional regulator [Oleidesulfovibrio alaskensis]|uniref:IclR family transcriptional regulator n=1 Tax=Oleidesulfovibrio alaskensis TaxID=58180 RepID=UPI000402E415|nr:IclR family transcriptional regulator C-terminal domain-containing protein [Oleidesulfovibrio alaskensis]MBG0773398.1 helix-turn-helix domain-containing protein [Oleidesulfovibrio alaskensis]